VANPAKNPAVRRMARPVETSHKNRKRQLFGCEPTPSAIAFKFAVLSLFRRTIKAGSHAVQLKFLIEPITGSNNARGLVARTSHQDFFALWKDADPDIPILKQAKVEYANLQ
jgi:hypothetical protein